jgi:cupin fold WbuC family metalloprotein
MREADGALFNTDTVLTIDGFLVEELKARARRSPRRRYRLCLHHATDDAVQEMIVVHCRGTYARPHSHGTPLTYLLLDGELRVLFFDDAGAVTDSVDLGPFGSAKPFALRIAPGRWYMPVCLTPQAVVFESKAGPFRRDASNIWAPWSPAEDDPAGIDAYRRHLGSVLDGES